MRVLSFSLVATVVADLSGRQQRIRGLLSAAKRRSSARAAACGSSGSSSSSTSSRSPDSAGGVVERLRGGSSGEYDDSFYTRDDDWNAESYVGGAPVNNYDDQYEQQSSRKRAASSSDAFAALEKVLPDKKTGMIMVVLGAASTMLGISLFFEKNLVRVGNLLLLTGAPIVIGPQRASRYLMQPSKLRGSLVFALGFMLVLSGHPLIGIIVEVFGFCNLFGNLFPMFGSMLKRLPLMSQLAGLSKPNGAGGYDF